MSAKFLMSSFAIVAAVKALTLAATLLRLASLRVAVTTISPTSLAAGAAPAAAPAASAALAGDQRSAAGAVVMRHATNQTARFVMSGIYPDRSMLGRASYSAIAASRLCDHKLAGGRLAPKRPTGYDRASGQPGRRATKANDSSARRGMISKR